MSSSAETKEPASGASTANEKTKVLFVCLGNICRSPTAEAVFNTVVEKEGLSDDFEIDSCGTGGGNPDWYFDGGWSYHMGDPADSRMRSHASRRGIELLSRSRPLKPSDLTKFDYIIGMDMNNMLDIQTAADYWAARDPDIPSNYKDKVSLMCNYIQSDGYKKFKEVPDPYYGGGKGFELVLDLLEDACVGLLQQVKQQKSLQDKQ